MASKGVSCMLLSINTILYFIVIVAASWAVNHGIVKSRETASVLPMPARIFPIYFPFGNLATGFVIIYSLLAGIVGFITSLNGLHNLAQWDSASQHAAAASSLISWLLTLLAMGLACKEISIGWTDSNLRTLETVLIILSGTQLFCTGAIHIRVEEVVRSEKEIGGRV
ncbi:PREDICTED: uncharacterized protein LOC109153482 [Ipomoea nil]|uniref:uncharacterized protein LOC109153482 n=1 Tax=Ipomoea nil TaxID=35883 RepID=UPI000901E2D4|nr:PREDICTED: uncharacterized protein LOC109153482 [Ipomoea nil]